MPMIFVPSKPSWKGPMSLWMCYLHLGAYSRLLWNLSEKLCFEPSQIATVTNRDKSGISNIAICDLSQFVTKTVPWQIQSNNIENVFCVLARVPVLTFESERLSFDPFPYYLPYVLCIIYQTWGTGMNLRNVSNYIEKVLSIFRIYCCKRLTSLWDFVLQVILSIWFISMFESFPKHALKNRWENCTVKFTLHWSVKDVCVGATKCRAHGSCKLGTLEVPPSPLSNPKSMKMFGYSCTIL